MKKFIHIVAFGSMLLILVGMSFGAWKLFEYARTFRPAYQVGEMAIIWLTDPPKTVVPTMKLVPDDILSYVTLEIIDVPSRPGEVYKAKVNEVHDKYNKDYQIGSVVDLKREEIYPYLNDKMYIDNVRDVIRSFRFKNSFLDIQTRLDAVKRLQYSMEGSDFDIDENVEKYLKGNYIISDVFRINRVKRTIREVLIHLEAIHKMTMDYYYDYGKHVIQLSRLLELEVYVRRYPFGETPEGDQRLLRYASHMFSTGEISADIMREHIVDAYGNGADFPFLYDDLSEDKKSALDVDGIFEEMMNRRTSLARSIFEEMILDEHIKSQKDVLSTLGDQLKALDSKDLEIKNFTTYLIKYVEEFKVAKTYHEMQGVDRKFDIKTDDILVKTMEREKVSAEQMQDFERRQLRDIELSGNAINAKRQEIAAAENDLSILLKKKLDLCQNRINGLHYDVGGGGSLRSIAVQYDLGEMDLNLAMEKLREISYKHINPDISVLFETKVLSDMTKRNDFEVDTYIALAHEGQDGGENGI